jgi:hypothetical protein
MSYIEEVMGLFPNTMLVKFINHYQKQSVVDLSSNIVNAYLRFIDENTKITIQAERNKCIQYSSEDGINRYIIKYLDIIINTMEVHRFQVVSIGEKYGMATFKFAFFPVKTPMLKFSIFCDEEGQHDKFKDYIVNFCLNNNYVDILHEINKPSFKAKPIPLFLYERMDINCLEKGEMSTINLSDGYISPIYGQLEDLFKEFYGDIGSLVLVNNKKELSIFISDAEINIINRIGKQGYKELVGRINS